MCQLCSALLPFCWARGSLTQGGLEFGSRAHFSASLWPSAHVKGYYVLGMHNSPNHRQRLKSTPFLRTRSHLRWQGEVQDSHSSLQILLTSQASSFPSLLPQGSPHCFSYLQKAEYVLFPAAPLTPAPYACARMF